MITDFGTDAAAPARGALAAGAYEYGITASTAAAAARDETPASTTAFTVAAPEQPGQRELGVDLQGGVVQGLPPHRPATPGPWQRIGTSNGLTSGGGFTFPSAAFDTTAPRRSRSPTRASPAPHADAAGRATRAIKTAYAQNPFLDPALTARA